MIVFQVQLHPKNTPIDICINAICIIKLRLIFHKFRLTCTFYSGIDEIVSVNIEEIVSVNIGDIVSVNIEEIVSVNIKDIVNVNIEEIVSVNIEEIVSVNI